MRVIGLDIHRAFAEEFAWEDGELRRFGPAWTCDATCWRASQRGFRLKPATL